MISRPVAPLRSQVQEMNTESPHSRYSIESVAKACDLLQVFIDEKAESLSLSELTARLSLNKNAVFRMLTTLTNKVSW